MDVKLSHIGDLESFFLKYSDNFNFFLSYLSTKEKYFFDSSLDLKIDQFIQNKFPKSFGAIYSALQTPGDGSCLWHMFSLIFFGDTIHTNLLRFVSVFVILRDKHRFISFIRSLLLNSFSEKKEDNLKKKAEFEYAKIVLDARNMEWGNEYHILSMAIAFNSKVYIYSEFRPDTLDLSLEILKNKMRNSPHLLYKPNNQTKRFVCGFFSSYHYSSILPNSHESIEIEPLNNIFQD